MDIKNELTKLFERKEEITINMEKERAELNKINLQARKLKRILKDAEEILAPQPELEFKGEEG